MAFDFTEEQLMLKQAAREFAENQIVPRVKKMEETGEFPTEIILGMAEHDFFALTIPQEFGGLGLGHLARMIVLEEIGRASAAVAMALQVFHLGIEPIVQFGSPEQKKRLLPALARGQRLATVAVTEATGGSDPTGAQTVARPDGDGFILNGRKVFITNSHLADVVTVLSRIGDDPKNFVAFILENGMEGFRPGRKEHKVGLRGCNTGEIILENCRVPRSNMLGNEGDGLKIALKAISESGRAGMAGCALGVLNACLEASVKFANERVLYGKPISKLQAIQWKIADILTDLEASRLLAYRAAKLKDENQRCDTEMAMAKYYSTEAAIRAAKNTCDIHGGYGVMMEFAAQRLLRDAQVLIPSAGTSEIMKVVIARAALS